MIGCWCAHLAIGHDEDVASRTLEHVAIIVEAHRFVRVGRAGKLARDDVVEE